MLIPSMIQLNSALGAARSIHLPTRHTGVTTDLAIRGEGFFILRDPDTGEKSATRRGDFRVDALGRLVTLQEFRVQGFNSPIRIGEAYGDMFAIGDISLNKGTLPAGIAEQRCARRHHKYLYRQHRPNSCDTVRWEHLHSGTALT